ncbi:clathrin adaptor complexes medium subunit family protein [Medicago truncatula]|uniref:Clathrin adaptor complexes medium subunit family protein n=1 Tax=Medicago truncatula TaxID=3880 RepID=A0A072UWI6_MEDTR|nr:clathrin adaptor complexes medium subunit family protein [Medicago truncatula]
MASNLSIETLDWEFAIKPQDQVVYDNSVTYMLYNIASNVCLVITVRQNSNAASLLFFLYRLIDVFKHYFEELEEEVLRDNFVVVVKNVELFLNSKFSE